MASTTSVEAGRRAAVGARVRTRRRGGLNGAAVRSYLGIAAIVVFCLAPFYWMVVTAFRDVGYTFDTTPWPTHVTMDNFRTAFSTSLGNHFGRALINSAIIGICTTVLAVMGVVLGAAMFPVVALLTPLFQLFTNIHWIGGYQALIIPDISFALPLTVYTLTAFFAEMPWELEQAALVDGATPVHHRDPRVHRILERVPAGQRAVQ